MAVDRLSLGTCITNTLPMMSFHFLKSSRWRRRVGSLICHLEAGEDKNIFLVFAVKITKLCRWQDEIIVKVPPVTVLP